MSALYAFLRIADDLSDGPGSASDKRRLLSDWGTGLDRALAGHYSHRLHEAMHHTVTTFHIPRQYLDDVLAGVAMDLGPVAFATFEELRLYCYLFASAVGLACLLIWGFTDERAKIHAEETGLAFQFTKILRALGVHATRVM